MEKWCPPLMMRGRKNYIVPIAVVGSLMLTIILVAGTIWMGSRARRDTEEAVRLVSLLYLDELAGRREQVVEDNLREKIETIRVAIDLMTEEDISDKAHLEAYQARMKQLYHLDNSPLWIRMALYIPQQALKAILTNTALITRRFQNPRYPYSIRKARISASLSRCR